MSGLVPHAAGWTTAEARLILANGNARWLVTATAYGHEVYSEAESQTDAWRSAEEAVAEQVEW